MSFLLNPFIFGVIDTKTYLYNLGDEKTALTGGWINGYSAGTILREKRASTLYTQAIGNPGYCYYSTSNQIDLTAYSKICVEWRFCDLGGVAMNYYRDILIGGGATDVAKSAELYQYRGNSAYNNTDFTEEFLDISSLSGIFYIKVGAVSGFTDTTAKIEINNLWLE